MKKYIFFVSLWIISISFFSQSTTGKFELNNLDINSKRADLGSYYERDDKVIFLSPINEKKKNGLTGLYRGNVDYKGNVFEKENIHIFSKDKISKTGVAFTKDLKTVYFSSNNLRKVYSKTKEYRRRRVNNKKSQLFKATVELDGSWSDIKVLPFSSKRYTSESPVLSIDEKQLYFVSNNKKETLGGKDIFVVAINDDGSFGEPKNLGSTINTKGNEVTPFITKDKMLYFSSDGHPNSLGKLDVYVSDISNTPTIPVHLDAPINSKNDDISFIINSTKTNGFISSNREKRKNNYDMYSFKSEGLYNKECLQEIVGIIKDKKTEENLTGAIVALFNEDDEEIEQVTTLDEGNYSFSLDCNKTYNLFVSKKGYQTNNFTVTTNISYDSQSINGDKFLEEEEQIVQIKEIKSSIEGLNTKVNPIYFGFDKTKITNEAKKELESIAETLNNNENILVDIAAYTDSRGSHDYNLLLSEKRSNTATKYLISLGVNQDRIISKGYGESKIVNKCGNGSMCSEEAHKKNRRVEFSFVNSQHYSNNTNH